MNGYIVHDFIFNEINWLVTGADFADVLGNLNERTIMLNSMSTEGEGLGGGALQTHTTL